MENNLSKEGKVGFIMENSPDGFIRVYIPSIEAVTWASNIDDTQTAVNEAIELYNNEV